MLDPSGPLKTAIIAWLKADTAIAAMISDRVFDASKKGDVFPHVTMGGVQVLPDKGDAVDGAESFVTIDAWSRLAGSVELDLLAKLVASSLDDAELAVDEQHLVDLVHESTRTLRDPDGVTRHAIITFRALTEPA